MTKPVHVAVVGYGMAAQVMHLPFISQLKEYKLIAILQRHGELSLQKYPQAKIVRDMDGLLTDPGIDLVVITTPNESHFPFASAALNAGKHVVLEKPFTNTSAEAATLIRLAHAKGKTLSVFHNRRYVADFLTMKKILHEKLLGEIIEFEGHFDRFRPALRDSAWREDDRPGSGIFYDLGSHLIDQALYYFGLPQTVDAAIRKQRINTKTDDYFDLRLDYGHMRVILKSGMLVREPGPRYMINGRQGSFIKFGEDPQEALLREGIPPVAADWGMEPEAQWGLLHTEINGKIVREKYPSLRGNFGYYYQNLYKTLALGAPLLEKPEHGFNTIRIIELALESNRLQRTVVAEGLMHSDYQ